MDVAVDEIVLSEKTLIGTNWSTIQNTAPLYLSLSCCGNLTLEQALSTCAAAGIRCVELAIGGKRTPNTDALLSLYRSLGMTFRAHHAFVWQQQRPFNLAAEFDVSYFERLCDWLACHHISTYSVHGGSYRRGEERERAYGRLICHLEHLQRMCGERGIALAVETMDRLPESSPSQNLLDHFAEVDQVLDDLPKLQLVVDLAHLHLWRETTIAERLTLLNLPPHRLQEIHLSDNDGERDCHYAISETTWWVEAVAQLPAGIPCVLESRMNGCSVPEVQAEYRRVEDWVRKHSGVPRRQERTDGEREEAIKLLDSL
jgi:sugar phosphate isomerase/epimerase